MDTTSAVNWQAAATLFAVVLTALFAWISYVSRTINERRKILSSNLFNLLEIWHRLKRQQGYDSERLSALCLAEIGRQMPGVEISDYERVQVTNFVEENMQGILVRLVSAGEDLLENSFHQSISQLAEVEPLFAYGLRANKSIKAVISEIDNGIRKSMASLVHDDKEQIQANEMLKGMARYMYQDAISDLERDLKWLAFRIGPLTYVRTVLLLRRSRMNAEVTQEVVGKLISELIMPYIHNAQAAEYGNKCNQAPLIQSDSSDDIGESKGAASQ